MYGLGSLGDCPVGQMVLSDGSCADDLIAAQAASDANLGAPNASTTINAGQILASIPTANLLPGNQTFAQWVEANSTLLIVSFSAIGLLWTIVSSGKRR